MRLQDPIEFDGPNRKSKKEINSRRDRSREMAGKEKEPTRDRWRKKERRGDEWEKDERRRPRERWQERQMNRETKGHMRTARRGGCPAVGDYVKGGRGDWARGRGERGIKQPRHRIVKGKVLLLRPPADPRLELIGFKGELFGYLQRHVLFLSSVVRGATMLAFLYYLLRARAAKEREAHLNFIEQFSLISFRHSKSFLCCDCVCIGLSNQSQEKEFLDWLVLILSQ